MGNLMPQFDSFVNVCYIFNLPCQQGLKHIDCIPCRGVTTKKMCILVMILNYLMAKLQFWISGECGLLPGTL